MTAYKFTYFVLRQSIVSQVRVGAFGTQTRVQPRLQRGKDQQFDEVVKTRVSAEVESRKKRETEMKDKIALQNQQMELELQKVADKPEHTYNTPSIATTPIDEEIQSLVIDNSSGMMKVGFAGDDGSLLDSF